MLFFALSAFIVNGSMVLMQYLRGGMGEAVYGGDTELLVRLLILVTVITVIRAVSSALMVFFRSRFHVNASYKMRTHFMRYFLRIPFSRYEKTTSGDTLSILSNDLPWARELVGSQMWEVMGDVVQLVALFGFMFIISPGITLVLIAMIPVLAVLQMLSSLPIQKTQKAMSDERANFNAVVNDSLQNISTVAAYSLEQVLEERYLRTYDGYLKAFRRFMVTLVPLLCLGFIFAGVPLVTIFSMAGHMTISGYMNLTEYISFTSVALMAVMWVATLAERFNRVQTSIANAKRLIEKTSEPLEELMNGNQVQVSAAGVEFKDVTFAYDEESPVVLDSVCFEIKPGTRTAFVGASGSGKSTVLKLLMGLYTPASGSIYVGDSDTGGLSKNSLREAFAYVPQDSFLFPEPIFENITGEKEITDLGRLEKACSDAGILDFVNSLPDKFNSILAESSENISGGQRQRIALARAFYKDAPIILFDEATSALDPTTEAAILENFETASRGKTVIMVAHRPRAIASCERVIVMDAGKIVGSGTHEELLDSNDEYRRLYGLVV